MVYSSAIENSNRIEGRWSFDTPHCHPHHLDMRCMDQSRALEVQVDQVQELEIEVETLEAKRYENYDQKGQYCPG